MVRNGLFVAAGAVIALVVGLVAPAGAADDLVIRIDQDVVRGSGTVEVARQTVPTDLVGQSCEATLVADNNDSVHDGNNLIVATGDDSVTFPDVESEAFQETTASGEIVLGEEVVVSLQFGQDGVSSGGLTVTFDCTQDTTTTTSTTTSTTTTEVPVEVLPETQVSAPTGTAPQAPAAARSAGSPAPISFAG